MRKKTTKTKLKAKLEKVLREYIRLRDKFTCQWCGKVVSGSNCHVSHVIPKSHGNSLRFDSLNLKVLCFHCHINKWHKDPIDASEWFIYKFPERWQYLMNKKEQIVKFSEQDYKDMIEKTRSELC